MTTQIKVTNKEGKILTIIAKDGIDGKTPSKEEVIDLIKPLIPEPIKGEDGYTPIKGKDYFDGEKGEDGKDGISPDTQEIIDKVLSLIPKSKTGKVFNQQEIIDAVMVLIEVPIEKQNQVIQYIQRQVASKTYSLNELDDVNLTNLTQTNNKYDLGSGKVKSIVAGSNITVDSTDPQNPIVSSTSSEISIVTGMDGGGADSTYGGTLGRPIIWGGSADTVFPSENTIIGGGDHTTTGTPLSGGGA